MPQDGYEYEVEVAESVGGEVVPGSGSGKWVKMDVHKGPPVLFSCKWTSAETRTLKPTEFDEVMRAVRGPGGIGGEVLPALAIGVQDRSFIVMDVDDWAELVTNREPVTVQMGKAESRRALSGQTPLQRRMEKEE